MFWKKREPAKLIPVLPKNYRRISLKAIDLADDPRVFMNKKEVFDFSAKVSLPRMASENVEISRLEMVSRASLASTIILMKCGWQKPIRILPKFVRQRAGLE